MLILILSVHPRLRGELRGFVIFNSFEIGSSPLTRELFDFFNVRWLNNGSSPLTRELTRLFSASSEAVGSSRLRGELRLSLFPESKKIGSSPLTRGTHSCSKACSNSYRFIPAYAGNSIFIIN